MSEKETWTGVKRYITESFVSSDPVLDAVLAANAAAGLPAIDVAPNEGKFLHLLALLRGSRKILEIGTLGGYSTICQAVKQLAGGCSNAGLGSLPIGLYARFT